MVYNPSRATNVTARLPPVPGPGGPSCTTDHVAIVERVQAVIHPALPLSSPSSIGSWSSSRSSAPPPGRSTPSCSWCSRAPSWSRSRSPPKIIAVLVATIRVEHIRPASGASAPVVAASAITRLRCSSSSAASGSRSTRRPWRSRGTCSTSPEPNATLLTQEIADFVSGQILGVLAGMVFRWWAFPQVRVPKPPEDVRSARPPDPQRTRSHQPGRRGAGRVLLT